MRNDLSALPAWWAADGDKVWCISSQNMVGYMEDVGLLLPDVEWCGREQWIDSDAVCPWGWSPLLVNELKGIGCPVGLLPSIERLAVYRQLSGRECAVRLLEALRSKDSELAAWKERLCGRSFYCREESEVASLVSAFPETILKAPWSGSGKGLRLGRGDYKPPLSGWCRRQLKEQGGVVVEPLYHRCYDFAFEFYADQTSVHYTGLSVFFTTQRGTYGGNWVASEQVKEAWLEQYIPHEMRMALVKELSYRLTESLAGQYDGCLGVDMMLCDIGSPQGLAVHPCVEINMRRTMGQVSLDLFRWLAPGSEARFCIDYEKTDEALWHDHIEQTKIRPLCTCDGLMVEGYVALTPVTPHTHYRACLDVSRQGKNNFI